MSAPTDIAAVTAGELYMLAAGVHVLVETWPETGNDPDIRQAASAIADTVRALLAGDRAAALLAEETFERHADAAIARLDGTPV